MQRLQIPSTFSMLSRALPTETAHRSRRTAILSPPTVPFLFEKLFTIVTRINLESRGDLRVLAAKEAAQFRKLKRLPSWVPDSSAAQYLESLSLRGANCNWTACGKADLKLGNKPYDSPRLHLQGHLVNVVAETSDDPANMPDVHLHWAKICKVARGLSDYYVPRPEAQAASSILVKAC
ncbi:hypothetical protein ACJZ2D_004080 [Fusarium nematophilum]